MTAIDLEAVATAMRRAIYTAWQNTLIGSAPPVVLASHDQMAKPKVGDWVIEASTIYGGRNHDSRDLDGVGILEKVLSEPVDIEWDEAEDGPHPMETTYYLRTLDGRLFRWHNASIIAAPDAVTPVLAAAIIAAKEGT